VHPGGDGNVVFFGAFSEGSRNLILCGEKACAPRGTK
jgi:hypothetical protein